MAISEWALWVAVVTFAFHKGGSSAAGLTSLALLIPSALVAPYAGAAADGHRPDRVLMRAFSIEALALAGAATATMVDAPLFVFIPCAAIAVATQTFVAPSVAVLTPGLVHSARELSAVNVRVGWCDSASVLLGPGVAALLMAINGPGLALASCSALALCSVALVAPLVSSTHHPHADPINDAKRPGFTHLPRSVRALAERPGMRGLLLVAGAQYVVIGALDLVVVVLAIDEFGMGSAGPGVLSALIGLGAVANSVVASRLVKRPRLAPLVISALAAMTLSLLLLGVGAVLVVACITLPVIGFGRALLDLTSQMLLQRSAPAGSLAGVFAAIELIAGVAMALGSLAAQLLIHAGGSPVALAGLGLFLAAVLGLTVGGLRRADESADVPIVAIRLLRTVPAFAMLPPAEMEAVARSASDLSFPGDTEIIRQGDVGDRFYVIIEGSVDVDRDGATVATLTRGGQFGEVALIADVPRTATVTSRSSTRVLAIERDDFLVAVTGHEPSHAAVVRRARTFVDAVSADAPERVDPPA